MKTRWNIERTFWPLLLAITAGGLVARLLHFSLTLGSDDQVWVTVAREIGTGAARSDEPVYYTRLVWTWVLIAWGWLGSIDLEWTAVLMFLLSGLTSLCIALATRPAFGPRAALLAAIVYSAHPLAISFDPVTLPDGLAVCMLAAVCWTFMRYLASPRYSRLVAPGLLIGVLFGVKNYFMLVSIPCALAILALFPDWKRRISHTACLAVIAAAALVMAVLLGVLSGVSVSSHVTSAGNYVKYVSQGLADPAQGVALKQFLGLLAERSLVLSTTFTGFGTVMGLLTLGGLAHSVAGARRSPVLLFAASGTLLQLAFLMFMPVSLSPLIFTQIHERYLTVVLPTLAISSGVAFAAVWDSLRDMTARIAVASLFTVVLVYCLWIPNDFHDRYRTLEIRGLEQVTATGAGGSTLLVPLMYRRLVPDSYRKRGVDVRFEDLDTAAGAERALDEVKSNPSVSIMIFRTPFRSIRESLRTGDYDASVAYGSSEVLMKQALSGAFRMREVRVPYDTTRVWLDRAGIRTRGQLVGWIISGPGQ